MAYASQPSRAGKYPLALPRLTTSARHSPQGGWASPDHSLNKPV